MKISMIEGYHILSSFFYNKKFIIRINIKILKIKKGISLYSAYFSGFSSNSFLHPGAQK